MKKTIKLLLVILSAVFVVTAACVCASGEGGAVAGCILGDTDSDGFLTVTDARTVLRLSIGLEKAGKSTLAVCDMNGSGTVDVSDARLVLRCAIELDEAPAHRSVTVPGKEATCFAQGLSDGASCSVCGEILSEQTVLPKTEHKYMASVYEPTCAAEGYTLHLCIYGCGSNYRDEETEKLPHKWDGGTVISAATCTENGLATYACVICDSGKDEVIPATGHNIVTDESRTPGCVQEGLTQGSHCEYCGMVTVKQESIPATGHKQIVTPGRAATCTEDGLTDGITCGVCGETLQEISVIKSTGHSMVTDAYRLATCTENGLTGGTHCKSCGYVEISQKVLPAKGHKTVIDKGYPATCDKEGRKDGTHCTVCNNVIEGQEVIPAKGHTETTVAAIQPTCEKTGSTSYLKCTVCGKNVTQPEVVPATGHIGVTIYGKAATCTASGYTDSVECERCGKTLVPKATIARLGHDYKSTVTPATCTTDGYTTNVCSRCGSKTTTNRVTKLGHALKFTPNGDKTHVRECTRCNTVLDAAEKCALTEKVTPPTCTAQGYTDGDCKYCKQHYRDSYKDMLPHTPSEPVREKVTAATCTAPGSCETVITCTVCEKEISRTPTVLPATEHTVVTDEGKAPGCTTAGITEGSHCSVCGVTLVAQEEIAPAGHAMSEWAHGFTEDSKSCHSRECGVCGEKESAECVLTAEITKAPTADESGEVRIYCDICGYQYTAILPATGKAE